VNNGIILAKIVTNGSLNPLIASSFTFATTGSTDPATDITNARLYYTGPSANLSTSFQLASVANPSGTLTITPYAPVHLAGGDNYFWLTYDIPATATLGDVVDACFISVTVSDTVRTPTVSCPAGSRPVMAAFCGTYTINPFCHCKIRS
jgi:hypothetical protein